VTFADVKCAEAAIAHYRTAGNSLPNLNRPIVVDYCKPNLQHKSFGYLLRQRNEAQFSTYKHRPLEDVSETEHVQVPGMTLIKDFVTEEEEKQLLDAVYGEYAENWNASAMMSRRVQHYGYEYDYLKRRINVANCIGPLPSFVDSVVDKMSGLPELQEDNDSSGNTDPDSDPDPSWYKPVQLTVNEYEPGQGIGPHIDNHSDFGHTIISLSLMSDSVFYFRSLVSDAYKFMVLPRRSLLLLQGQVRYGWMHALYSRKSDMVYGKLVPRQTRVSLTFRRVRSPENPCLCEYKAQCDNQQGFIPPSTIIQARMMEQPEMNAAAAPVKEKIKELRSHRATHLPADVKESADSATLSFVEQEHVVKFYDTIANHFSKTRHTPWPQVARYIKSVPAKTQLLDVGCGNGRHMVVNPDIDVTGCDASVRLVELARERSLEVAVGDALNLPYRDNSFDVTICIAVIHHLSSIDHRVQALRELIRVVCVGGEVLVTAWALEQQRGARRAFASSDVFVPWHLPLKYKKDDAKAPAEELQQKFDWDELPGEVDNNRKTLVLQRYCHVFAEGEIDALFSEFSNVELVRTFYDSGNWCVIVKKTAES
jgi:alkylated DNA repair protein alkB homolog 8